MTRVLGLAWFLCAATAAGMTAGQDPTRADASAMEQKVAAITARAALTPARPGPPVRTMFSEHEINSYMRLSDQAHMPDGVVDPHVTMPGDGQFDMHATVDLDAVRKSKDQGLLGNMLLHGSVDVHVTGHLQATNGSGLLRVDVATVNGVQVPPSLLQDLVSYYSKTPDMPNGFPLDKPFNLPLHIREIQLIRGAMVVIQ